MLKEIKKIKIKVEKYSQIIVDIKKEIEEVKCCVGVERIDKLEELNRELLNFEQILRKDIKILDIYCDDHDNEIKDMKTLYSKYENVIKDKKQEINYKPHEFKLLTDDTLTALENISEIMSEEESSDWLYEIMTTEDFNHLLSIKKELDRKLLKAS